MRNFSLHNYQEKDYTLKQIINERDILSIEIDIHKKEGEWYLVRNSSLSDFLEELYISLAEIPNYRFFLWIDIPYQNDIEFIDELEPFFNAFQCVVKSENIEFINEKWVFQTNQTQEIVPIITHRDNSQIDYDKTKIIQTPTINTIQELNKLSKLNCILNVSKSTKLTSYVNRHNCILRLFTVNSLSEFNYYNSLKIDHIVSDIPEFIDQENEKVDIIFSELNDHVRNTEQKSIAISLSHITIVAIILSLVDSDTYKLVDGSAKNFGTLSVLLIVGVVVFVLQYWYRIWKEHYISIIRNIVYSWNINEDFTPYWMRRHRNTQGIKFDNVFMIFSLCLNTGIILLIYYNIFGLGLPVAQKWIIICLLSILFIGSYFFLRKQLRKENILEA